MVKKQIYWNSKKVEKKKKSNIYFFVNGLEEIERHFGKRTLRTKSNSTQRQAPNKTEKGFLEEKCVFLFP